MKKQKLLQILSVLLIAALSISLFTACHKIEEIEESQVEKIVLWVHVKEDYELTAAEAAKFIELYNSSTCGGEGTGEGGTPEFGIVVYFRDGTTLRANDFEDSLEVTLHDSNEQRTAWYYVKGEELYQFVSDLAETAPEKS